jgi:outer membrane protein assembly factor BamD (BamD/ComL family)
LKAKYLIIVIFVLTLTSCANLNVSGQLYQDARIYVKEGRRDFAFLSLNEILRQSPNDKLALQAKFGVAEYYYDIANYSQAVKEFKEFLKNYKSSKLSIFAKAYLYKMISDVEWLQSKDAVELAESIKKEFFSKSAFFVFSEFKEVKAVSVFSNKYVLKEYVDKIDIFRNDKLFLSVSP